jgi:hypothetical protein
LVQQKFNRKYVMRWVIGWKNCFKEFHKTYFFIETLTACLLGVVKGGFFGELLTKEN